MTDLLAAATTTIHTTTTNTAAVALFAMIGALVGSGITAWVARSNSRRQTDLAKAQAAAELKERRSQAISERAGDFVAASFHAVLSLRDFALADQYDKPSLQKTEVWPTVDRVNKALVAIKVNDAEGVVEAVDALDDALRTLARDARDRQYDMASWSAHRDEVVGDLPDKVVAAAKAAVEHL